MLDLTIEFKKMGIKRQAPVEISQQNVPVKIQVVKVSFQSNTLKVTLENQTQKNITLPTINLTCYAVTEGGNEVGYNIIWVNNLGYLQTKTYSRKVNISYERIKIVGYINIDEIRNVGLKSKIQETNDYGETVIPVLKTGIIRL